MGGEQHGLDRGVLRSRGDRRRGGAARPSEHGRYRCRGHRACRRACRHHHCCAQLRAAAPDTTTGRQLRATRRRRAARLACSAYCAAGRRPAAPGPEGSRIAALHLGDHGHTEGRAADACEPGGERSGAQGRPADRIRRARAAAATPAPHVSVYRGLARTARNRRHRGPSRRHLGA